MQDSPILLILMVDLLPADGQSKVRTNPARKKTSSIIED
jgi:hypothetical protein